MNDKTRKVMFSSDSDEWETPSDVYEYIEREFGPFTLDPAATAQNTKCKKFFTKQQNGLLRSWKNESVFVNPPYTKRQIGQWLKKAYEESLKKRTRVVMIIPSRTDTRYWHDYCMKASEIWFIKGRVKFEHEGKAKNPAPFPSCIVVFEGKRNPNKKVNLYGTA